MLRVCVALVVFSAVPAMAEPVPASCDLKGKTPQQAALRVTGHVGSPSGAAIEFRVTVDGKPVSLEGEAKPASTTCAATS